jgi:hypothetical protein
MVSNWVNPCVDMANQLRIRIDWVRLQQNMSKQEGRAVGDDEIHQWLTDAGFTRDREDSWIVNEPDLGHLDPAEVLSVEDV